MQSRGGTVFRDPSLSMDRAQGSVTWPPVAEWMLQSPDRANGQPASWARRSPVFPRALGPSSAPSSTPELFNSASNPEIEQHRPLTKQPTPGRLAAELE